MLGFVLLASLWQRLEQWDRWLFMQVNSRFTNSFFDAVLPYFRDAVFWAPLYIFILAFIIINYGRKGWLWSLAFLCTVALADMTSARILKEVVQRPRPCWDPEFYTNVRLLLKQCNHSFSFTSNHAANHFGIATFISLTLYPTFKKMGLPDLCMGTICVLCPDIRRGTLPAGHPGRCRGRYPRRPVDRRYF